ncbi:MAG: phosphate ABC transporter permease subunit PstC [Bdellovibrio sp.]
MSVESKDIVVTKNLNGSLSQGEASNFFNSPREQDLFVFKTMRMFSALVITCLIGLFLMLIKQAWPVLVDHGWNFFTRTIWNPVEDEFSVLPLIYGTFITSLIAVILAGPISILLALFVNEVLPSKIAKLVGLFVEMIAAVPSIVFGLWGIFYLAPFIKNTLSPFLKDTLGFIPLFQGPSFGIGVLTASLILAVMIIPTISSICREVFKTVPAMRKEGALGLGATKFEMMILAIVKPSFSGIVGAIVLGLGRALGETMAVAMVIGNQPQIKASIFAPAATMASIIANEYAEAESSMHISALCAVGLVLFVMTLIVNLIARVIVWNYNRSSK